MPLDPGLLSHVESLDPLPISAQRLIAVMGDEDVAIEEIVEIVENDPAVAANLLRMANSPLYGGRFKIERLRDAVVRLGAPVLLDIALGGYLRKVGGDAPLYDLSEDDLWLHSAVAAQAAREIIHDAPIEVPASAGVAALVHDIGKLIMVRYRKANADAALAECRRAGCSFIEAERTLYGCDHAEVGGAIARRWNFPAPVTEAIERHHDYPLPAGSPILDAVVAANYVAKTIGVGLGAEGLNMKIDNSCLKRLGLDFEGFCRLCAKTAARMAELRKAYGLS
ncbi:MAG TPA: HDOD domain-containing protein [Acidobacteriota bacterium]|nr:HDOD domain-containing protein [Acidobacteriota bacterium]